MQPEARIVFVVMSAVAPPATVEQLARALAPHTVLVHHDFAQSPDFRLEAPNVRFVPDPRRTGWAVFGFTEGVFHSMRHALEQLDFDYLQLLSPTCLPIKPLRAFERHVAGEAEAHFDCIDVLADHDALMSVGYRAFTPQGSWRHRGLRRLVDLYFGPSAGRRDEAGVWLRSARPAGLLPAATRAAVRLASLRLVSGHPFHASFRACYGSPWLGARRHVVEALVREFGRPGLRDYFSRLRIADEFLVVSLLQQLVRRKGPLNHYIQRYDEAHVGLIGLADLPALRSTPAWFARKFPDDPLAPVRLRVLDELVGAPPWPVEQEAAVLRQAA